MYSEFSEVFHVFLINVAFFTVLYLAYLNYNTLQYWKMRNVPYVPAKPLWTKAALESFLMNYSQLKEIYYHSDSPCVGFFQFRKPTLLLRSPEAIDRIMNQDFRYFSDKRLPECAESGDPLVQHLLALCGAEWSYLRSKLRPSFTADKLRNMLPILEGRIAGFVAEIASRQDSPLEVRGLCGRLSMDCIAACAFGLQLNCVQNQNDLFIAMSSEPFKPGFWHNLKAQLRIAHPRLFNALRLRPYRKSLSHFFCSLVQELIRLKKEAKNTQVDFVYVLMKLLEEDGLEPDKSPFGIKVDELVAAQVFSFFVGGYETTSITMSNALFEIARDAEVKGKLLEEVASVIGDQPITYDNLNSLKYLASVIDEVLRLHPPVHMVQRVCREEYHIPGSEVVVEKGMEVVIPLRELQLDQAYHPQPGRFRPDRFRPPNRAGMRNATYLPFGDGPRHCIGFRFSLLELKLTLATLIRDFDFVLDPTCPPSLEFEEYARIYKPKNEIFLRFTKRKKT